MAEYTKATTTKLIKFTKRFSKDSSKKFNEQFKVIFKKFITLMKVTSKKLTEAKSRVRIKTFFGWDILAKHLKHLLFISKYDNIRDNMGTQGKLEAFKDMVENLDDSKRLVN